MDAKEVERTERNIDDMYRVFRKRVAAGRGWDKLSEEEREGKLNGVTGGRVFSGKDAKENGLVDELGGFRAAVHSAVEMGLVKRTELLPEKVKGVINELATPPEPEHVDVRIYPVERNWYSLITGSNESLEENLVKLGKFAVANAVSWVVKGDGMWEMERMLLDASEKVEERGRAGRGEMQVDFNVRW